MLDNTDLKSYLQTEDTLTFGNQLHHLSREHDIVGVALSLTFNISDVGKATNRHEQAFMAFEIHNDFIGLILKDVSRENSESKILWTDKKKLLNDLRDSTIQNGIEYERANLILAKFY
jgi:hypothetical protein